MLRQILRRLRHDVPRVCFVHVPKCAGTSVDAGVRQSIGILNRKTPGLIFYLNPMASNLAAQNLGRTLQEHRYDILHYALSQKKHRYVSGHFSCSLELLDCYHNDWKFITVLRSPEERLVSQYFYNRYKKDNGHFSTKLSFDEWLDTADAVRASSVLLNRFGQGDVDRALKTLNRMDIVGDMSQLSEFSERLSGIFERKVTFPNKNASPAKGKRELSPSQAQRVKELCRVDTTIYNEFRNSNS